MRTLREKYKDIIVDIYYPLGRKTYKNERGEERVRFVAHPINHGD